MSQWDFWPKKRQAHYGTLAQYDMWYFGTNEFRVVVRGKGTKESPLATTRRKISSLLARSTLWRRPKRLLKRATRAREARDSRSFMKSPRAEGVDVMPRTLPISPRRFSIAAALAACRAAVAAG